MWGVFRIGDLWNKKACRNEVILHLPHLAETGLISQGHGWMVVVLGPAFSQGHGPVVPAGPFISSDYRGPS
jgi:hypothetical protein